MTTKIIASTKAKNHFGRILDDIIQNRTRYVIKRRGAPQAIMLSLPDFEQIIGDEHQQSQIGKVIRELVPEYNLGETISQE
ncbi:MAG: type II toxin-antitoxin system Phd/YefM family antitoxin [Anaerolineae bacterium]|nr:type II toxin-antitoxin system Phd/YefM family antitoxin [Anaerolineae bacterium]